MQTGGVRCWGLDSSGQLGDGANIVRSTPPTSDVLMDVKAIAAGEVYTCALMDTGGVRCWGDNNYGQLGNGGTGLCAIEPISPACPRSPAGDVLTGAVAIATGLGHTCALMDTGGLRCWGSNGVGQLGDGTRTDRATPPATDVLTGVQAIAAGGDNTCALMDTGGVRCWGVTRLGRDSRVRMTPVQVVGTCE